MIRKQLVGTFLIVLLVFCLLAQLSVAEEEKKGDKGKGSKDKKDTPVGILPEDADQLKVAYDGFWLLIMAPCVFCKFFFLI